jgi:hypothetical protein
MSALRAPNCDDPEMKWQKPMRAGRMSFSLMKRSFVL